MSDALETDALPDPTLIRSREELATALTALRQAANLSVRELAAASGVPHGTISGWMSGQHAPVAAYRERFDAVLTACGITAPADRALWWEAATRARQTRSMRGIDGRAPYQGLYPFEAADSAWFFGRDELIDRALRRLVRLSERRPGDPPAMMTVIGASGSGKSSLIRAGIVPALGRRGLAGGEPVLGSWRAVVMTPGRHPNETLSALTVKRQTVLCIDQFEELWTQVESEEERTRFLESLLRLADSEDAWIVVIGLRADFYGAASRRPELHPALQDAQLLVGPMSAEELQAAIVEPARRAGAVVDDDLVRVLLGDLASRSVPTAHDPGGLPLLSHALLATWERSSRRRLSVSDYYATGGIAGAIEQAAESTYAGLDEAQQACVPRLFLRLISLDGDTIARRRLQLNEVLDDSTTDHDMAAVVDAFTSARLLTRHIDAIDITHEALITAWPRLNGWITANRAGMVIQRRVTLAARQWAASGRSDELLLPAARLASWREWSRLEGHGTHLNRLERDFLTASEERQTRMAGRASRQQESRRRLGVLAVVLSVVCALLAAVALGAYVDARHYRAAAESARDEARSRQVALQAAQLRTEDPALAAQLALAAYRISPTLEASSALLDATAVRTPTRIVGRPGPMQVRSSPVGPWLATADSGGALQLYDTAAPDPVLRATVQAAPEANPDLYALAWSSDGRLVAVGGRSAPTLWDVADPTRPRRLTTLSVDATTYALAFVPRTHTLLAGTSDGRVVGWLDAERSSATEYLDGVAEGVSALAVSADGTRLAVAGAAGRLELWRLAGNRVTDRITGSLPGRGLSAAISPDGREVAVGTTRNQVRRWAIGDDELTPRATLTGFENYVNAVAYGDDSRTLVAGSSDQSTAVFDLGTSRRTSTMPGPAIVVSAEVTGDRIATASSDGTVRLWQGPDPTSEDARGPGWQLGVSTNQKLVAEATGQGDGAMRVYAVDGGGELEPSVTVTAPAGDGTISGTGALSARGSLLVGGTTTGRVLLWGLGGGRATHLSTVAHLPPNRSDGPPSLIQAVAVSPNDELLATVDATRPFTVLWDVSDPRAPTREPTDLAAGAIVLSLTFSPDSRLLAVGDANNEVRLWDVRDPSRPRSLGTLGTFDDDVNAVAFSPDGRLLAVGSADRTVRLFDVADPEQRRERSRITDPVTAVTSLAFSGTGDRLAVGTADGSVRLYGTGTQVPPVAVLQAAGERINDARFIDADQRLVATGPSGALHTWSTGIVAATTQICTFRGTPIEAAEWTRYLAGIPARPICP